MPRARIAVAMGLTLLGVGPFALADASPAKLVYERGPGADACPDEAGIRRDVAARLGHDPFVESADRTVAAKIVRDGSKLRGTIELKEASGKITGARSLESKQLDCKELASAMTLAISLALDPLAGAPPKPSASASASASAPPPPSVSVTSPPPPPPPPSASASAPPPPAQPPPEPHGALRVSLGAFAGMGFGPRNTLALVAAAGYRTPRWSFDLEGRRDVPLAATVGAGTATSSIFGATLVPCLLRGPLSVCGLLSVGALQASGGDVATPRSETAFWAAAGVRIATELQVWGPVALAFHADVLVPFVRTTLQLNGEDVYTTSAIAVAGGLRFVVRFD